MIRAVAWRGALAALAWLTIAEGDAPTGAGAAVAIVAVAGAVAASLALSGPGRRRLRIARVPRLAAFFLVRSLAGGVDVAFRALSPTGRVRPGFVTFDPLLPEGAARALFIEMVGVMPGTLVAEEMEPGGALRVHVIDTRLPVQRDLEHLSGEIRAVFARQAGPGSPRRRAG